MEFLLEILTEEMPSSHVKSGMEQLAENLQKELQAEKIKINRLQVLGTCRRLAVLADVEAKQPDEEEIVVGPPKKIAFTADGTPTPAALGFIRSHEATVADLQVLNTAKGEYIGLRKPRRGRLTQEILPEIISRVLASLTFPKMMRWGESTSRFSRPVKNIFALYAGQPLPVNFQDWPWRPTTFGHRLHANKPLMVSTWQDYREQLKEHRVIIDPEERRRLILDQAAALLQPLGAQLYPDEELLEKLVLAVEHPLVIIGSFPDRYLILPVEIISTVLREGQKVFSVVKQGQQIPYFIGVADQIADPEAIIRRGYERVIRARLEDALFFWNQDLKVPLKERVADLGRVIFQEKLGTYLEKTERLKKLVSFICLRLGQKELLKEAVLAAELCKADLVTEMVREFPSLQGKVGGVYSRVQQQSPRVAQAIYEHYQPLSLDSPSPASLAGALLALADKVDSLVGPVGIGAEISSSSDPLGLRRQAQGICKLILDHRLRLSLSQLLKKAVTLYGDKLAFNQNDVVNTCLNFFGQRLRFIYEKMGYRYDLVNASLGAGYDDIYLSFKRLKALDELKGRPEFEPLILMVRRVNNILRNQRAAKFDSKLLEARAERELFSTFRIISQHTSSLLEQGELTQAFRIVFKLQTPLDRFFDQVLVMAEDRRLRQNRLGLLGLIKNFLWRLADFSQVVLEGEKENAKHQA
ncbi:MAG: glycine--tRNA ligase subunit beta [Candidatus Aminicenantales bacterium]